MSDPMFSSKAPFVHRARKAVNAAVIAGVGAAIAAAVEAWPDGFRSGEVGVIVGAFFTAAVVAGWSTYKIRNTATVEGSDPLPAPPRPAADPGWPRPAR